MITILFFSNYFFLDTLFLISNARRNETHNQENIMKRYRSNYILEQLSIILLLFYNNLFIPIIRYYFITCYYFIALVHKNKRSRLM